MFHRSGNRSFDRSITIVNICDLVKKKIKIKSIIHSEIESVMLICNIKCERDIVDEFYYSKLDKKRYDGKKNKIKIYRHFKSIEMNLTYNEKCFVDLNAITI